MKCFVINLDRRKDRLERFTKTFGKHFDEIIREPAVDSLTLRITPELKKRINPWDIQYAGPKLKNLTATCLSHLNVWKKIRKLKEPVFVFEDDCAFINEMVEQNFTSFFTSLQLPPTFGIIWFNGTVHDTPGKPIDLPFVVKEYNSDNTAEGYFITPSFANELIYAIENDLGAVDNHMELYTKKTNGKSYRVFPPFFCQFDRRDTDIQIK